MQEVVRFMQSFIHNEYAAFRACYLERDEELFEEAQAAVDRLYAGGLRTMVQRNIQPDKEWFAKGEKQYSKVRQRPIFQIKEYENPEYGAVWGAYVGSPLGWTFQKDGIESPPCWSGSWDHILYVAQVPSRVSGQRNLKIIAEYSCASKRYVYGSRMLEPLGEPVELIQFHAPHGEAELRQYEADAELAKRIMQRPKPEPVEHTDLPKESAAAVLTDTRVSVSAACSPEQEAFIRKFGPLEEKVFWEGDDYADCLRLLGGRFYTHGFFPNGSDPYHADLPWTALAEATDFLNEITDLLRAGGCTALGSAGNRPYYPFLCVDEKMAYLPNFLIKMQMDLPNLTAKSLSLTGRSCLFWGKGKEAELKEYLNAQTIRTFKQVSKKMKETLKDQVECTVVQAPYRMELPSFIGGKFAPGLFAGLFTTQV